jgi:hypothetical protein
MKEAFIQLIKETPLYWLVQWRLLSVWEKNGKTGPPPRIVKLRALKHYAQAYDLKIFVETGTALGDMIALMKDYFDTIYSIELDRALFQKAKRRFRGDRHVKLMLGDSGTLLKEIMKEIDRPTLFWLDAHYMGGQSVRGETDTPILLELDTILALADLNNVIVVDDARFFGTDPSYPTIGELTTFVRSRKPRTTVEIKDDMIRIIPTGT